MGGTAEEDGNLFFFSCTVDLHLCSRLVCCIFFHISSPLHARAFSSHYSPLVVNVQNYHLLHQNISPIVFFF